MSNVFFKGMIAELSKQAATQVIYPQKKPNNTLRNIGYGLGAAALGAGAYGAHKAGLFSNLGGHGGTTPEPKSPTPAPTQAPAPNRFAGLIDKAVTSNRAEYLDKLQQNNAEVDYPNFEPNVADKAAPGYGLGLMGASTLSSIPKVNQLPGIKQIASGLDKTLGRIPMGAAKALPIKAMPVAGIPLSMYSNLRDRTVPNYYMNAFGADASKHPSATKAIQGTAGALESAINFHPVGMAGNAARSLLVDMPMAHSENFSDNQLAKGEGYRSTMAQLVKALDAKDPQAAQTANEMSDYFLKQHGEGVDKQIDPSTWDRLRMNQFNLGPHSMIPGYNQYRWMKDFIPQLMHVDEPGSASSGDAALAGLKEQMLNKMLRNSQQSRLANQPS